MLTRMRFKNWRSLKDVEIDNLTPITVFIGANSSGKTNIIDALSFLRRMLRENVPDSTYFQVNREAQIRTLGVPEDEPVEIGITFQSEVSKMNPTYTLGISEGTPFHFYETIRDNSLYHVELDAIDGKGEMTSSKQSLKTPISGPLALSFMGSAPHVYQLNNDENSPNPLFDLYAYIANRWQILGEGFSPALRSPRNSRALYDTYLVDEETQDLPILLSFMKEKYSELYGEFQEDLKWFMKHVTGVEIREEVAETRIVIQEGNKVDAPTVSAGTSRALAMFTAYHALSMRYREMPGLVVIEEPDTALNPGLLRRFVEQLRVYASGPNPRQFILTTHNPGLLDFFEPEEVRVVSRDEQGHTHVARIPDHIKEIWLDKYGLGEVWTTNSFEGLAE